MRQTKIVDKNYASKQELFGQGDSASGVDFFQFDVMTPHSQIIDYNFSIKIPSGNLGDYYANYGNESRKFNFYNR